MGSKDAVMQRMAEQQAMRKQGLKFIALELNDMTKNRIQGAHILHGVRTRNADGLPVFHFEERGGPIKFEFDELEGTMIARVLDCEHNRGFLASMSAYRYWSFIDPDIEKEIIAQAKGITKKAIREMPDDGALTDEELEAKAQAFREELERRRSIKADSESEKEAFPAEGEEDDEEDENTDSETISSEKTTEETLADNGPPEKPKKRPTARGRRKTSMVQTED